MDVAGPTVSVEYMCHGCKVIRVVAVPERGRDQCVLEWVKALQHIVAQDHERAVPECPQPGICDLKIPIVKHAGKDSFLGEAPRQ